MQILVVEQDAALGQFLARSLRTDGHDAEWVGDGEAALAHAAARDLDLMVLDLLLPQLSGLEVLEQMQTAHASCSIITLTTEESTEARVRYLNQGADDCIGKPFSLQELIARCRAQLRRRSRLNNEMLELDGLVLHRRERSVKRHGVNIELTTKEFTLLEHLLERRGRCASRSELLQRVFQLPGNAKTNVVEVYINYIRRKLSPDCLAGLPPVIETVRGSGYRVAAPALNRSSQSPVSHMLRAASL